MVGHDQPVLGGAQRDEGEPQQRWAGEVEPLGDVGGEEVGQLPLGQSAGTTMRVHPERVHPVRVHSERVHSLRVHPERVHSERVHSL
ncbi:hypothetical protein GCM10029964_078160 [Kibdelosporangium lantanae]